MGSPRRVLEEDKASPRSSVRNRIWDAIAIVAIGFVLWKIFVAPRAFEPPAAHPAPHAIYPRLDGGTFDVAEQRGHVVFLDFYASWCTPCKIELPLVESWSRQNPGAVVVPVDVGETRSVAVAFARRYSLVNVALDERVSARPLFGVNGFPTVVVIDSAGDVRAKWVGLNPAIGLAMSNAQKKL